MYLLDYMKDIAEKKFKGDVMKTDAFLAKKFGVTPRTVQSWRYGVRHPSVEMGRVIVRTTRGVVDYEGIYAPYKKHK